MAMGRRAPAGGRGEKRGGGAVRRRVFQKRKVCRFCADPKQEIDYKNVKVLKYFTTERGKIIPRRISGNCARHQRKLTEAIHRARMIALMPFTATHA
jgi:small subunit ribosomal protein S18